MKNTCRLPFFLFALFLVFGVPEPSHGWDGVVDSVVDGETLVIRRGNSSSTVKLYGIDAPELGQTFGQEAKQFLEQLVLNKTVSVKKSAVQNSAEVFLLSGYLLTINKEMLTNGFAWSIVNEYTVFESIAKKKRIGIWSSTNPISPKEYRRLANVQKKAAEKKAEKNTDEDLEQKFLEQYFIAQDIRNKKIKEMEQYLNQSEYSISEIHRILSLYDSSTFENIFINRISTGNYARVKEELKVLGPYVKLLAKCIKTVRDQENIEDIKKKELIEKLEAKFFKFDIGLKNISRKIEEHFEIKTKNETNETNETKAFTLKNGSVSQCDAISMYVNASSMGANEKTIVDITFHYTSTELGGALYWKGENLDCRCRVYSNGIYIDGNTDTLTSDDQHFFVELSSGDMEKIRGGAYVECELRPDVKKIEIRENLYFR